MTGEPLQTIGRLLEDRADRFAGKEALVYTDRKLRYSFQRLREGCDRVASGLVRIRVRRGDRVALWAGNHPEWLILELALLKLGATVVPVPTDYDSENLAAVLRGTEARAVVLEIERGDDLRALAPELEACPRGQLHAERIPSLRSVVTLGDERRRGMYHFKDLIDLAEAIPKEKLLSLEAQVAPETPALLLLHDGRFTHREILEASARIVEGLQIVPEDRLCLGAPFFHPVALTGGLTASLVAGATLVTMAEPTRDGVEASLGAERCTILSVPENGRPIRI